MGIFSAIGRLFRAVLAGFGFKIDSAADSLSLNPAVMQGQYDAIIRGKNDRIQEFLKAVAAQVALNETKKMKLTTVTADFARNEKLKQGAAAKAKQLVTASGGDQEKCKANPEYVQCQNAYRDFSSTGEQLQKRIDELENDIKSGNANILKNKSQAQTLLREIENLKSEKNDAVADVTSATEQKKIADAISGISADNSVDDLNRLRDLRQKALAGAAVSRELSGLDAKAQESEFLNAIESSEANNEFDALMGFKEKEVVAPAPVVVEAKLPE